MRRTEQTAGSVAKKAQKVHEELPVEGVIFWESTARRRVEDNEGGGQTRASVEKAPCEAKGWVQMRSKRVGAEAVGCRR
ncbi:hypothetical protein GOP47_0024785 [Adiantum capillus-veneris]|uniref:Uncharacterized protein n=1 Tax=Adiantum capillus-veneris TaxID=13818 RepID=A0A9D4U2S5_ADICA|nr:hypothetical protein GOP47_0024785 [Adiantum capillus-veneris]